MKAIWSLKLNRPAPQKALQRPGPGGCGSRAEPVSAPPQAPLPAAPATQVHVLALHKGRGETAEKAGFLGKQQSLEVLRPPRPADSGGLVSPEGASPRGSQTG